MGKLTVSQRLSHEVIALLECSQFTSDKFYEIELMPIISYDEVLPSYAMSAIYGRRGSLTPRRTQKGIFEDNENAQQALEKLVINKLKRGYHLKKIHDEQLDLF